MLCSDLTVTLMIMIIALVLNHGSAAKEILHKNRPAFPSRRPLEGNFPERNNRIRSPTARALRRSKRRNWPFLDPVAISLKNAIGKYELKGEQLKALYQGVKACGLSDCGKFRDLIPEDQKIKDLKCVKRKREFKRSVLNFLADFHNGTVVINKSFEILLEFEKISYLYDPERQKILREFNYDLKSLILELESLMTNERLSFEPLPEILSPAISSRPRSRTDLMVYEWRVIQDTKRFLKDWRNNLQKILRCWRKGSDEGRGLGKRATRRRLKESRYRRPYVRLP